MRRERLIWPAKNSNTVIRHNLQIQKTPPERGFLQLIQQLSAKQHESTVATVFFLLFYALNHSRYAAFCKMTAIFYCVA